MKLAQSHLQQTYRQHGLEVAEAGTRCIRDNIAEVLDVNELVGRIPMQHDDDLKDSKVPLYEQTQVVQSTDVKIE